MWANLEKRVGCGNRIVVHAGAIAPPCPSEGLCSEREARWFYVGWSRVYDAMQPFFTSDEMREAGLDLLPGGITGTQQILDVGAGTGTLSLQVLKRAPVRGSRCSTRARRCSTARN